MKLSEYVQGVAREYVPVLKQVAAQEAAELALKLDAKLRDPKVVKGVLHDLFSGVASAVAEVWDGCPHGTPKGSTCERCPKPKIKKSPKNPGGSP